MRDVVNDVETRHAALVQKIDRVRFLFAEDRDEHIGARDFFLAGRLHMEDGPLNHALKALRGLRVGVRMSGQTRRVFADEIGEYATELLEVDSAGLEHFGSRHAFRIGKVGLRDQGAAQRDQHPPQRDVIGNSRVTHGAEKHCIIGPQLIEPVLWHHPACFDVGLAAPVELVPFEREAVTLRRRLERLDTLRHDLASDAVAGDHGDPIYFGH